MQLPDPEQFNFKEVVVCGDECLLITPKDMKTDWNDDNARFRSCLIRKSDNHVISQGFYKFTNFSENPTFQSWDDSWPIEAILKIDGSLLCISKYKGELIIRTRGTIDARQMANGHEIDFLIGKYPKLFYNNPTLDNEQWTVLVEWTTPTNIICLREHEEPTLTLLGVVYNGEGGGYYMHQITVDALSKVWDIARPTRYYYASIEECISDVKLWTGKEGVVLYAPRESYKNSEGKIVVYPMENAVILKKIKSDEYLAAHRLSSGFTTIEHVIDLFLTTDRSCDPKEFYNYVQTMSNFELAEKLKEDIAKVCEAYSEVLGLVDKVKIVVDKVRGGSFNRKDQASHITMHYHDWRTSTAFLILDNRPITDKLLKIAIQSRM